MKVFVFVEKKQKIAAVFIGLLVLLNIFAWQEVFDLISRDYLEAVFFDVGQGDAIFIETPQKHQLLIDGGPGGNILEKLAKELPFWDRSIDVVILTHPEKDHLAGLLQVLKGYKVDYIVWTGIVRQTPEYQEWRKLIKEEGAKIIIAQNRQNIKAGRASLEILYPLEKIEGQTFNNSNDTSIVSRLTFGQNSFLFTGDISREAEEKLIREEVWLGSDVLKVAHHASKTSSSEEFLKQVSPQTAVIQAGKNNQYGHPASETLQKLEKFSIQILRTDINGDIKILSDGKNLKLKTKN